MNIYNVKICCVKYSNLNLDDILIHDWPESGYVMDKIHIDKETFALIWLTLDGRIVKESYLY